MSTTPILLVPANQIMYSLSSVKFVLLSPISPLKISSYFYLEKWKSREIGEIIPGKV